MGCPFPVNYKWSNQVESNLSFNSLVDNRTIMLLLILLSNIQFVVSQMTNLSCDKQDLQYSPNFCRIRNTDIPDVNNINFVDFKKTMTGLSFYGGVMDSIPPNVLKIGNITSFQASSTLMKSIKPEDFLNGQLLQTIFLTNFSFNAIQANLFQYAPNMQTLMLYVGTLNTIDVKAFSGLQNLTSLTMANLNIPNLLAGVFDDLIAMTALSLENNLLTELPVGLFAKNLALDNLKISYNKLIMVPPKLLLNQNLKTISIRYNLLEHISTFRALSADYTNNVLKTVTITKFTTNVLLMNNNITKLKCAKDLSIRSIYLENNLLHNLRCIKAMKNLTSLTITSNKFKGLNKKGFKNLNRLSQIEASSNLFKVLRPMVFVNSKTLTAITCDDLARYDNLKILYPKLWKLKLNTKDWSCSKFDNVTSILKNQSIWLSSNGCQN